MYYNGCFLTKNPSQALSGKMQEQKTIQTPENCAGATANS